jgi:dTDP-4-amino-4,6-dideoxygalactose transaminase
MTSNPVIMPEYNEEMNIVSATHQNMKTFTVLTFDPSRPENHVFLLFVIQDERRDDLKKLPLDRRIQTGVHYPIPIHLHKVFSKLGCPPRIYPVAEKMAGRILSRPIFPEITDAQVDSVNQAIKEF